MSRPLSRAYVVGMGEVGRRLAAAMSAAGVEVLPVTRSAGWEEAIADGAAMIIIAVREEALAEVVERITAVPPERLVFVQNGWVRPLLARTPGCTRGLIWFTSKGDFFRVLRPSVLAGPWAVPVAAALAPGGITAVAADDGAFAAAEAEKMGFNCVVGLPLAVHGLPLARYLEGREGEARAVFSEALQVTARALGVRPPAAAWREFVGVSEPIGWLQPSSAKALDYRNGAVVRLARQFGMNAPVNARLLDAAGFRV
jgi:ketopantoate reductase